MPQTPILALPYPAPTDSPDGAAQIRALAEALDRVSFIVGEVRFIAIAAAPQGWLACNGQAVNRTGATAALFAAIGTTYGAGNGSTTFNVPNLLGRCPVGAGASGGTGLTARAAGWTGGAEAHTLAAAETPVRNHDHHLNPVSAGAGSSVPSTGTAGSVGGGTKNIPLGDSTGGGSVRTMGRSVANGAYYWALQVDGVAGTYAVSTHNNMQPSLAIPAYIFAGA